MAHIPGFEEDVKYIKLDRKPTAVENMLLNQIGQVKRMWDGAYCLTIDPRKTLLIEEENNPYENITDESSTIASTVSNTFTHTSLYWNGIRICQLYKTKDGRHNEQEISVDSIDLKPIATAINCSKNYTPQIHQSFKKYQLSYWVKQAFDAFKEQRPNKNPKAAVIEYINDPDPMREAQQFTEILNENTDETGKNWPNPLAIPPGPALAATDRVIVPQSIISGIIKLLETRISKISESKKWAWSEGKKLAQDKIDILSGLKDILQTEPHITVDILKAHIDNTFSGEELETLSKQRSTFFKSDSTQSVKLAQELNMIITSKSSL